MYKLKAIGRWTISLALRFEAATAIEKTKSWIDCFIFARELFVAGSGVGDLRKVLWRPRDALNLDDNDSLIIWYRLANPNPTKFSMKLQ
jgi:hypothetical protein